MPTRFKERQAGQQFGVAVDLPVAQGRMIPVRARPGETWVSAARQFVVFALYDEFGPRKGIVEARVIRIEMRTDEEIDVVGLQPNVSKLLNYIFPTLDWRRPRLRNMVRGVSTINQDVLAIASLDKIATR